MDLKKEFTRIYTNGEWTHGSNDAENLSGTNNKEGNVKVLRNWLINRWKEFDSRMSLLDLGCGDLLLWKRFIPFFLDNRFSYTGVDIVDFLIEKHRKEYSKHQFICQEIEEYLKTQTDKFHDVIMISDVLFHLENSKIQNILKRVIQSKYGYLIFCDSHPYHEQFEHSTDINKDRDITIRNNALYTPLCLMLPPFNLKPNYMFRRQCGGYYYVYENSNYLNAKCKYRNLSI